MRHDETFAKNAFAAFLTEREQQHRWRAGWEPPDYYLHMHPRNLAVEVSRAMKVHDHNGHQLTEQGIRRSLENFAKRIWRDAEGLGILSGSYALQLTPIPDFRAVEPALMARCFEYILMTQAEPTAERLVLARYPRGRTISISKVGTGSTYVGAVITIDFPKRDPQVIAEIGTILSGRLEEKRRKLKRVRLAKMLLLVDSYSYGDDYHWRTAAEGVDFRGFHTVARIHGATDVQVLHSNSSRWRPAG